jgi:hypothetical protein
MILMIRDHGPRFVLSAAPLLALILLTADLNAQTIPSEPGDRYLGFSIGLLPVDISTDPDRKYLRSLAVQMQFAGSAAGRLVVQAEIAPWKSEAQEEQYPDTSLRSFTGTLSVGGLIPPVTTTSAVIEGGIFLGLMKRSDRREPLYLIQTAPLVAPDHDAWHVTSEISVRIRSTPTGGPAMALEVAWMEYLAHWYLDESRSGLDFRPGFRGRISLLYPLPSRRRSSAR